MIAVWFASLAFAQQQACESPYTQAEFQVALDAGRAHVEAAELEEAEAILRKAYTSLPCLDSLVDRSQLAAFGRWNALAAFYQQDEVGTVRWGRLARSADPDAAGDGMPPALIAILDEAGDPAVGRPTGSQGLMLPRKGAVFMNGRLLLKLEAKVEVPYLVQIFDGNGWVVRGHWQDGSAFPEELMGEDASPLRNPRWYNPVTHEVSPRGSGPKGDPAPTGSKSGKSRPFPLTTTVVAGGLVAGSAAMYAGAGVAKGRVTCEARGGADCPSTGEDLTRLRTTANLLVLGAAVALVGGLGVGVSGFLLDGGGGFTVAARF